MKFTAYRLKPKTPLHLGEREGWWVGSEVYIHSDTLFSAFCHAHLLLYGRKSLEEVLKMFLEGTTPFLISSAFPYEEDLYYFPLPKNCLPKSKKAKKAKFIEKRGFERLLKGEDLEEVIKSSKTIPPQDPYKFEDVPRVALNRLNNHPGEDFFYFGQVMYRKEAGLFFLVELKERDFQKRFEGTLNLMADEGIGGDRSAGKGHFEKPERISPFDLDLPSLGDGILNLSLYYPPPEERGNLKSGFYELLERRGYIYSPYGQSLRRRTVRMFEEGSVFPANGLRKGHLVDITPEIFKIYHPVYRYGFLFRISCKLRVEKE